MGQCQTLAQFFVQRFYYGSGCIFLAKIVPGTQNVEVFTKTRTETGFVQASVNRNDAPVQEKMKVICFVESGID